MSEEQLVQQVMAWVAQQAAWVPQVLMWIGAFRVVCKWFSRRLEAGLTQVLARAVATETQEDDALLRRFLAWPPYRVLAFLVDLFLSIKLPLQLPQPKPVSQP